MSLDTYTGLQAAIKGWLMNRADIVPMIPDWITLAETEINAKVRHRSMIKRSTASPDGYRIALPTDWLEAVNIQITANGAPRSRLRYASPEVIDEIRDMDANTLIPTHYSIIADELELVPTPGAVSIEMIYYAVIPPLGVVPPNSPPDTPPLETNWLLQLRPDAYLYGALVHAAPYMEEDARVPLWVGGRDAAISNLNEADRIARHSGGPLVRRLRTFG